MPGPLFWGAVIGAVAGVILLEIAEVIVEGIVQKKVVAMVNGIRFRIYWFAKAILSI
ncbi:MAG: hypothetical protein WDO16_23445 [Bacteroidota bacterium]